MTLFFIGCSSESIMDDFETTGFDTVDSSTTLSVSSETTDMPCEQMSCSDTTSMLVDEDLDIQQDPDAQLDLMCPMNWCARSDCPGGSCRCVSAHPPIGYIECIYNNVDASPMPSAGCPMGWDKMGCVADVNPAHPGPIRNKPPIDCTPGLNGGGSYICPPFFHPEPLDMVDGCSCPQMEGQFCPPSISTCD